MVYIFLIVLYKKQQGPHSVDVTEWHFKITVEHHWEPLANWLNPKHWFTQSISIKIQI